MRGRRDDDAVASAALLRYLNQAHLDFCGRKDWTWLLREFLFTTSAPLEEHACTFAAGSRLAVIAAHAGVTVFGHSLLVPDESRVYRITNVDSTRQVVTLDRAADFTGASLCTIPNDEIALPFGASRVVKATLRAGGDSGAPLARITTRESVDGFYAGTGTPSAYSTYKRQGIPTPLTPTVGGGVGGSLTGTYTYWISHYDRTTGQESRLSPPVTATYAAETVTVTPVAREDFSYRVYRSVNGGSSPHFLTEVLAITTSYSDAGVLDQYLGGVRPADAPPLVLKLDVAPDDAYDVMATYFMSPPPMLSNTDELLVPDELIPVLLDGAEAYYLGNLDEDGRAANVMTRYERGVSRALNRDMPGSSIIKMGRRRRAAGTTYLRGEE